MRRFAWLLVLAACGQKQEKPEARALDASGPVAMPTLPVGDAATAPALPIVDAATPVLPLDAGVDGAAVLKSYRRVLHIGDSMVGFKFGLTRALGARFEADGAKFFSIPITNAGIGSFEKGTELEDAIKKTRPDLVLLTLGANNATSPAPEYYVPAIKRIVKKMGITAGGKRRCFWIGPPLWKPDKVGFIDVLAKSTEPCTFFDSSRLTLDKMTDGIHPTNKGGEVWAEAVMQFLKERMAAEGR